MTPMIIAFLIFVLAGIAYFYAWIRSCLFILVIFFSLNIWICHELLAPGHNVIFWIIVSMTVLLPAFLITLFGLDMMYGLFCFDMSYSWVFVWAGAMVLYSINLIIIVASYLMANT